MAFKPSQLDMIGKYESVCMEKQQDLLKRYVFFRKLDLRQDTTFHMSSRDASFHGSRYGRWQIKRKYLILREIVPVDRLADSCAFGQEHSYEWVYWIKNRDTLIQVDGRRPRVPIDTLVRISDEKYYKEIRLLHGMTVLSALSVCHHGGKKIDRYIRHLYSE